MGRLRWEKDVITVGTPTRARVSHGPNEGKSKDNCDMRESKIAGEDKPRDEGKSMHRTLADEGCHHISVAQCEHKGLAEANRAM